MWGFDTAGDVVDIEAGGVIVGKELGGAAEVVAPSLGCTVAERRLRLVLVGVPPT